MVAPTAEARATRRGLGGGPGVLVGAHAASSLLVESAGSAAGCWSPRSTSAPLIRPSRRAGSRSSRWSLAKVERWKTSGCSPSPPPTSCTCEEHDHVVAGDDLLVDRAVVGRDGLVEQDGAVLGDPEGQPGEALLAGTGELAADRVVVVGQHADAEPVGLAEQRPGRARGRDRERHQRRVDAHRGERRRGDAGELSLDRRGHGDDAGRGTPRRRRGGCAGRGWSRVGSEVWACRVMRTPPVGDGGWAWAGRSSWAVANHASYGAASACCGVEHEQAAGRHRGAELDEQRRSVCSTASAWVSAAPSISGIAVTPPSPWWGKRSRKTLSSPV